MHEIVRLRAALAPALGVREADTYQMKRDAIRESLYGVDKDGGAVDIAQLRLWLSMVVDEEDPDKIEPLPNLDYKIVPGDSLTSIRDVFINEKFWKLEELQDEFFGTTQRTQKTNSAPTLKQLSAHSPDNIPNWTPPSTSRGCIASTADSTLSLEIRLMMNWIIRGTQRKSNMWKNCVISTSIRCEGKLIFTVSSLSAVFNSPAKEACCR